MALPKKYDFNDYDNYITEPNPTTSAEAQDYFRNMDMLVSALVDTFLWQPNTTYAKGDVVKSNAMPSGVEAVCVNDTNGKSSNVEPEWGNVGGGNVNDGTCFWQLRMKGTITSVNGAKPNVNGEVTVPTMQGATSTANGASGLVPAPAKGDESKSLRGNGSWKLGVDSVNGQTGDVVVEGVPTGFIAPYGGNNVPTGWLACNGATVSRTTYAKLFAAVGTTYGAGDGSTTFNLPNLNNNSFLEGSNTAGTVKSAGLPNITGSLALGGSNGFSNTLEPIGAFSKSEKKYGATFQGNSGNGVDALFNASKSNSIYGASTTVQPKSVTVKYCIKY